MEYRVVMLDLPTTVRGYVLRSLDGFNTVVLNSRLNIWQNRQTCRHEIDHIINGDFDAPEPADVLEEKRHR